MTPRASALCSAFGISHSIIQSSMSRRRLLQEAAEIIHGFHRLSASDLPPVRGVQARVSWHTKSPGSTTSMRC
jgi:hypothetical protein